MLGTDSRNISECWVGFCVLVIGKTKATLVSVGLVSVC